MSIWISLEGLDGCVERVFFGSFKFKEILNNLFLTFESLGSNSEVASCVWKVAGLALYNG